MCAARQTRFDIARCKDDRPFCLVVSMTHPHDPYTIPRQYWHRYDGAKIDMPRVLIPVDGLDPHSTRVGHVSGLGPQTPTEAQVRAARCAQRRWPVPAASACPSCARSIQYKWALDSRLTSRSCCSP